MGKSYLSEPKISRMETKHTPEGVDRGQLRGRKTLKPAHPAETSLLLVLDNRLSRPVSNLYRTLALPVARSRSRVLSLSCFFLSLSSPCASHARVHVCVLKCTYVCVCVCVCMYVYVCGGVWMREVCVCVCVSVSVFVCAYVYIYTTVYVDMHTSKPTYKHMHTLKILTG